MPPIPEDDLTELEEIDYARPIPTLVRMVLLLALKDRATEVRFEPLSDRYQLSYRVGGTLFDMVPPPLSVAQKIVNVLKVISDLDITRTRVPQKGYFRVRVE